MGFLVAIIPAVRTLKPDSMELEVMGGEKTSGACCPPVCQACMQQCHEIQHPTAGVPGCWTPHGPPRYIGEAVEHAPGSLCGLTQIQLGLAQISGEPADQSRLERGLQKSTHPLAAQS